jgi:hypothetical protein
MDGRPSDGASVKTFAPLTETASLGAQLQNGDRFGLKDLFYI